MDEKDLLIQNIRNENEKLKEENKQLKVRCKVITEGEMCFFCNMKCVERAESFRETLGK